MKLISSQRCNEEPASSFGLDEPSVFMIDALVLRRACVARMLDDWSRSEGLRVVSVAPIELKSECPPQTDCRMAIFSIGCKSVTDSEIMQAMASIQLICADAPLVVISDQDKPSEVLAAFRTGASGFIPSSLNPEIALGALTFILGGGCYYPPSALSSMYSCPPAREVSRNKSDESKIPSRPTGSARLAEEWTRRQKDVIEELSCGFPNKVIARHLSMSEATVKVHLREIMRKLGVHNRTQVALCLTSPSTKQLEPSANVETSR